MRGINDIDPRLKRIKESLEESNSFLEKSCTINSIAIDLGDTMARTIPFEREMVGSKGFIRKDEFVKVITKALYFLGYNKTGALLEQETGITLHSSRVTSFMQLVLEGKWDESILSLRAINVPIQTEKSVKFIIFEQSSGTHTKWKY